MTRFIESFSTDQLLPPWQSLDMRMWSFVIPVERTLIESHLAKRFNAAAPDMAPYHYTPLAANKTYGLLCVVRHDTFSSLYEGKVGSDTTSHTELYWTFPVLRHPVGPDNLLQDPKLVWIQPFAFDNNSYVMFSAREIWGTEMEMAAVRMEGETPADLSIDMAVEGMAKFDPRAKSQSIGCMRMGLRPTATAADLHALLADDADLDAFVDILIGAGIFTGSFDETRIGAGAGMEVNTLRQFRDVFDMDSAAYRAIVSSFTQHGNIRDLEFYSGHDTVLEFLCSDSMQETLQSMFGNRVRNSGSQLTSTPPHLGAPGAEPTNWRLDHIPIDVALVIAYRADARFSIKETLHTYGQMP